jgi:hypothetical protein
MKRFHSNPKRERGSLLQAAWREDDGVLSFEWVLLITVIVIGIVGGLAAARDAIIDELGDSAESMMALDQSFAIDFPLLVGVNCTPGDPILSGASNSGFTDFAVYEDCGRTSLLGQEPSDDGDS